jgi:hypothetical protein
MIMKLEYIKKNKLSAGVIYGSLFLYAFHIFLSLSVSSLCVADRDFAFVS